MWEPLRLKAIWISTAYYMDSFTLEVVKIFFTHFQSVVFPLKVRDQFPHSYHSTGKNTALRIRILSFLYTRWEDNIFLLRITESVDFDHRPEFQITRKHNVSETESASVLG
jgi:hypothetical protein